MFLAALSNLETSFVVGKFQTNHSYINVQQHCLALNGIHIMLFSDITFFGGSLLLSLHQNENLNAFE